MKQIRNTLNNIYSTIIDYSTEELDFTPQKEITEAFIQEKFLECAKLHGRYTSFKEISEYDMLFTENQDLLKKLPLLSTNILELYSEAKKQYKKNGDLSPIKNLIDGGMFYTEFINYRFSDSSFDKFVQDKVQHRFHEINRSSILKDCLDNLDDPFYKAILKSLFDNQSLYFLSFQAIIYKKTYSFLDQIYFSETANEEIHRDSRRSEFVPDLEGALGPKELFLGQRSEKAFQNFSTLINDFSFISFTDLDSGYNYLNYIPIANDTSLPRGFGPSGRLIFDNINIRMKEAAFSGDMVAQERLQKLADLIQNKMFPAKTIPSRLEIIAQATAKLTHERAMLNMPLTAQEEEEIARRRAELEANPENYLPLVIEISESIKPDQTPRTANRQGSLQLA